jgi:hypothetical protein
MFGWNSLNGGLTHHEAVCYMHRRTQTEDRHTQPSMPGVGFEPSTSVFEHVKKVHALDCVATVIGSIVGTIWNPIEIFTVKYSQFNFNYNYLSIHKVMIVTTKEHILPCFERKKYLFPAWHRKFGCSMWILLESWIIWSLFWRYDLKYIRRKSTAATWAVSYTYMDIYLDPVVYHFVIICENSYNFSCLELFFNVWT